MKLSSRRVWASFPNCLCISCYTNLTQVILMCTKVRVLIAWSQKTSLWCSLIETFHYHIEVYSFKWPLRDRDRICNGHMEQIYKHFPELSHQCKVQVKFWPCTNCVDKLICHCIHDSSNTTRGEELNFLFIGFIHTKKEIWFCICHDTLPKAEALSPGK